jgi:hypothetical protein
MNLKKLLYIDRRIIYLVVAIGALIPIIRPIGLPVVPTDPVKGLYEKLESLEPGDAVIISYDYGPSSEPELNPMSAAILRHCFENDIKVIIMAIFPLGGVNMAIREVARVASEYPDLEYGVDYVNLGYKDGAQAAMKAMAVSIKDVFPGDVDGNSTETMPLVNEVRNYDDVEVVISLATGIIGEWWADLVNAQFDVPVAVGCTAVSAPKYYAFLRSGQMIAVLGGLKGASEYEELIRSNYEWAREVYSDPEEMLQSATTGMDVQSIIHVIIIAFIIFGNVMYFATGKEKGGR